jgi:hypothetical protein
MKIPLAPLYERGVGEISKPIFEKEMCMKNREKLLGEIFELALQHDMNYFG